MKTSSEQMTVDETIKASAGAIYGWGTEAEALAYARHLDAQDHRDVDLHTILDVGETDEEARERTGCRYLGDGAGCCLCDELVSVMSW